MSTTKVAVQRARANCEESAEALADGARQAIVDLGRRMTEADRATLALTHTRTCAARLVALALNVGSFVALLDDVSDDGGQAPLPVEPTIRSWREEWARRSVSFVSRRLRAAGLELRRLDAAPLALNDIASAARVLGEVRS